MRIGIAIAIAVGSGLSLAAMWVLLGSRIAPIVDLCLPAQALPRPASPVLINADSFVIGDRNWPLPRREFDLTVTTGAQGRIVLSAAGRAFPLGPVKQCWADPVAPQYEFVPEAGDRVSFTRSAGRLAWPAPFRFSILGGSVAKWDRYAYDRLRWTKDSGAVLEILWRDKQSYWAQSGWVDGYNNTVTKLSIRLGPVEQAVARYLAAAKGWTEKQYRLERQPATPKEIVVTAIYLQDEVANQPGAGQSVVVRVDKVSGKVASETGFQ